MVNGFNVKPKAVTTPLLNPTEAEKADKERREQAILSVHDEIIDEDTRTSLVLKKSTSKRYKQYLLDTDQKARKHLEDLILKCINEYEAEKNKKG